MSRSASQLDYSLTTRDILYTRPGTLESRARPPGGTERRLPGSQHSHNRPFRQREALTP
jgi:hypothetical protein